MLPEALARELEATATATYITPVLLGQATVYEFLRRGLLRAEPRARARAARARRDAMLAALERELPELRTSHPEGGYFLWAELDGVDAAELLARAEAAGVTFVKGADFGGGPDTLRLAYSFVSLDEIAEGVARLAAALPAAV